MEKMNREEVRREIRKELEEQMGNPEHDIDKFVNNEGIETAIIIAEEFRDVVKEYSDEWLVKLFKFKEENHGKANKLVGVVV